MTKFRKDLILQEKTVVHCNSEEKAIEFLKWAESLDICQKDGYRANGWGDVCKDTTEYYDLYLGKCRDAHYLKDNGYNILEYEDVVILREKEEHDNIVYILDNKVNKGIVKEEATDSMYRIINKNGLEKLMPKNNVWFDSPDIEFKITPKGIVVTGEEEQPKKMICPICHKPLIIEYNTNDNTKSNCVHICAFEIEINVNTETLDGAFEALCRLYNLIVGRQK